MKLQLKLPVALIGLCITFLANPKADAYTFTKIADTTSSFSSIFNSVAMNDNGTVAFGANLYDGSSGIFKSDGITTTTIADTKSSFIRFSDATYTINKAEKGFFTYGNSVSINNSGTVAFAADLEEVNGIFIGNGTTITTIDTRTKFYDGYGWLWNGYLDSPIINNGGKVAYICETSRSGGIFINDGITPGISDGECDSGSFKYPADLAFNDAGSLVKRLDGTVDYITWNNASLNSYRLTPDAQFGDFNINNNDVVAFMASKSTGEDSSIYGIFTTIDGQEFTTIADDAGIFNDFGNLSINDAGTVAFLAGLDTGGTGIFTGNNPLADKAIAIGDPLLGSTVEGLKFFREGLNNSGQIAFFATLKNGTSGIFRADPDVVTKSVPESSSQWSLLAFGIGAACILKRQQKPSIKCDSQT